MMERQRKRNLRDLNLRAWNGERDVFPLQGSLDSSMKKNTAFIKRLRTAINPAGQAAFLQEIRTLSLHKYLSEIISACFEGLCKLKTPGEVAAGVEVVSALHQRFGPEEFTSYIGWLAGRALSTPDRSQLKALTQEIRDREERDRVARQRVLLRVATELWLVGVLKSLEDVTKPDDATRGKDTGKGAELPKTKINGTRQDHHDPEPFPLEVLKDMLGHDREHVNLPLVVVFVKTFAWDVLGTRSSQPEERKTVLDDGTTASRQGTADSGASTEEEDSVTQDPPIVAPELRQRFRNILDRYFDDVKTHITRDQKHLAAQGRRNAEAYVKSGEVFEDRQSNFEKQTKTHEKLVANAQVLASALDLEMPDLSEKETNAAGSDGLIGLVKTGDYLKGQTDGAGIWEDEDERRFYENIIDLKERVPGILLEDRKKKADGDEHAAKKSEDKLFDSSTTTEAAKAEDAEEQSTVIVNKTVGAQVDALLARLPELSSRDQVDQFAIDFCFLNSKASRNRLTRAIQEIPKGRLDLLPIYSRLIATFSKALPDIPQAIVSYLDDEFRSLQRRKSKDFLGQVRMVNIRYIAELTKFGVVPEHVIFHCLKVSLDDFSRMNIEIIGSLLENCGRYLLRNSDSSPRMASFLETLQRKKTAQHLGQQERMLIENAMYYVNPPERAAIEQKERTPLDLYIRKLIYLDLSKRSLEKVTKQIRKLHWEESEVREILRKIFTKPGKIKYSNVYLLAVLLGALHRYHQDFTISIMDDLLERITVGLELNDFKQNQKRIAEVKYLGELYTYRMVDSTIVFDALYRLLNYGHPGGYVRPENYCPIDLPDDYFRIRLVSSLLETCGTYFDKGAARKKLDFFLTYLQYYVQTKEPVPMDVDFVIQDTFAALRPQWKIASTYEEASRAFAEACKQNYQNLATADSQHLEEPEDNYISDDGHEDGENNNVKGRRDSSGDDAAEVVDEEMDRAAASDDDDQEEHIVVTRPEEQRDPEADADFDRELAKLMSESVESRKTERRQMFDVPLPMRRAVRDSAANAMEDRSETASSEVRTSSTMKFSLLSKRGNRQQTRSINLPSDSNFAVAMRTQQQVERAEQQRIKSLVLNYDLSDETHNDGEAPIPFILQPNTDGRHNRRIAPQLVSAGVLNNSLGFNNSEVKNAQDVTAFHQRFDKKGRKKDDKKSSAGYAGQNTYQPAAGRIIREPSRSTSDPVSARRVSVQFSEPLDAHATYTQPRIDKGGSTRSNQRARKLQLSDVDWT